MIPVRQLRLPARPADPSSFGFCRVGESTLGVLGGNPRKVDYVSWGRAYTKFAKSPDLFVRASDTSGHEVITSSNLVES